MKNLPFRRIHMDFHTSPLIGGIGEKFNADEFVKVLKDSHVNAIHLTAKCHHGMYYYPTKIGTVHPSLKFDLFGSQLEACRKNDISVIAYTPVVWNEDWSDRHPEWLQVNMDGVLGNKKPFYNKDNSVENNGWRYLCLNSRGLVDYTKAELREIHDLYKPDAYWIDIIWQNKCVCRTCMNEMKKMGLNPQVTADVMKHDRYVEIRFMNEIYDFMKEIDINSELFFNSTTVDYDLADDKELSNQRKGDYLTYLDIESLPTEIWSYSHFPICINYWNTKDIEIGMMNGKFHKSWGDFGSLRNKAALEYECFRALANGAKCCIGDQLHPSGRIDKSVYSRIGEVYKSVEEKEAWCKSTKKVSQIGVYTSERVLEVGDHNELGASSEGVYRMLTELHYLYDFIDFNSDIEKYELVILPDKVKIPENIILKIRNYLKKGGKLLLTGSSGLTEDGTDFALEEFGIKYVSEAEFNPRYLRITEENFSGILPMDYVMYEKGVSVKALDNAEILAYVVNPYFNRTYDKFCSHRQTPPSEMTDEPFIVKSGNTIHISNPLFKDYALNGNMVYKNIIEQCIGRLLDRPILLTDLPSTAELTLRSQEGRYVLHALHYIPQRKCRTMDIIEDVIPVYNAEVKVRLDKTPDKVYLAPSLEAIDFKSNNGYVSFKIQELRGHQMVVIE